MAIYRLQEVVLNEVNRNTHLHSFKVTLKKKLVLKKKSSVFINYTGIHLAGKSND